MKAKQVINIVISGTNFWNPGDDFVRDGVIRVLRELFSNCQLNFLFYNFNQDFFPQSKFSGISNTVSKGDLDQYRDHIDAVVIAGLSAGTEIKDLYNWIIANGLQDRVYLIGAGYENSYVDKYINEEPEATIFKNARVITGRTRKTPEFITRLNLPYHHINCPAILSVPATKEVPADRKIERVGFSIQLPHEMGVPNHCCSKGMYDMAVAALLTLSEQHYEVEVVAHHKSEYFHFLELLKGRDIPVHFSSFYQDLFAVYPRFDLVVTTRLHSSLFANGHGIPGIIINDTDRHTHCLDGFPHSVWVDSIERFVSEFERVRNCDLAAVAVEADLFKKNLLATYLGILEGPFLGMKQTTSNKTARTIQSRTSQLPDEDSLPIHIFTIVLNGEPFIREHIEIFSKLPFRWHWHIVEGVADLKHDTAWSLENGARITDGMHHLGRSNDGTSEYLDELERAYPENVTIYRKPHGVFWDGKLEMVNAPLKNISEECLLWQIDSDEIWTTERLIKAHSLFVNDPSITAAYYTCRFFVGDGLVITTKNTYGNHPSYEWLRTWRYRPGDSWATHEPPRLFRNTGPEQSVDVATLNPVLHDVTEANGLIFDHYAYVLESQLRFKESYYGYADAVDSWKRLQNAGEFPVRLRDYFPWVKDEALVDRLSGTVDKSAGKIERILWIRSDSIGDNILASAMLPYLREHYRRAKITVVCEEHIAELYEASPCVEEIITFNRERALRDESYVEALGRYMEGADADIALNTVYSRDNLSDFLTVSSSAEERIAFYGDLSNISQEERNNNNRGYTRLITSPNENLAELERHREFLRGIGIETPPLEPVIWTTEEDETFAENFFEENGLEKGKTIAFFPCAKWEIKLYRRYGEALGEIIRSEGFKVIGLGARDDSGIIQDELNRFGVETINLAGETTLRRSAALLRRCRLAVGADSALAHIACAVKTPNVVVLGGGHFGRFMPYSPLTTIACLPLECYGCNWSCRYRRNHCVADLKPTVLEEALRVTLSGGSDRSRIIAMSKGDWEPQPGLPAWTDFGRLLPAGRVEFREAPATTGEYLVSAIVSTYNAERFIRGKLEDLEAQTIADRIEIIVIDSGSRENERATVEEFQRRYTNILYIRTEQRETVYQAWNRGIRAATGRFITNANTDDRLRRDAVEVMVSTLLANPDKVLAYGDSIVTVVPHETFDRCTPHDYLRWPEFDRERLLEFCYIGPHPVWRREVHDTIGYFDERYQCAADYEFWLRLAMKHEFIHIPEPLGLYWLNEGTVSRKGDLPVREAISIQQKYRKLYAGLEHTGNPGMFRQSALAHRYCKGMGLEIGGSAHNPFGLNTLNVDIFDSMETIYKMEEMRLCGSAMPVDIVAPGDDIPLPDGSQDFIVSSHVLEHFPNPVKALLEWDRLVRPGGVIFMIVPHKERTFDQVQLRTELQHIVDDFYNNATDPHPQPQGHDHCWITEDIVQLCKWMIRELGVKWDIVEVQDVDDKVGNGFTIVIRKTGLRHKSEVTHRQDPEPVGKSLLFVVHGFPPVAVGGVEVYTRNLAMEMTAKGNRVTVLFPVVGWPEPLYSFTSECVDGLTLIRFHVPRGHTFASIISEEIDSAFGDFLKGRSFDFIHIHHLFDNLSMSMISVAKKSGVPVAVTLHDFWFICPRYQLFIENNATVCTGPESTAKCAECMVLAGWFPDVDKGQFEQLIALRHEYVRRLLPEVDLIFTPSHFVADIFDKYGFGGGKITVAPLGIGKFRVERKAAVAGPRFGFMGTIHPVKNVLPLVQAFAKTHGEASLHLYGGGEAARVKQLRCYITDPRITYHGSYTPEGLPEILAGIDVLVVPSLVESYCLTVREALSAGIPVLAARVGGIPEVVQDGTNGLLFDPLDSDGLTRLLQQCIDDDTVIRKLNGNAMPVTTITGDAEFLLARYAAASGHPVSPKEGRLPEACSSADKIHAKFSNSLTTKSKTGKIKVAVYSMDTNEHACGHYRFKAPLTALAESVEIMWGIRLIDNAFCINTEGIESADIIVVQRFLPRPNHREFLDYLCSLGKPVVYEIDDLLTQLPASNPNYDWGMVSAPEILDFMPRCAAVIVSTDELKSRLSAYNDNIYVLPNMLDSGLWTKPSPPSAGPVVIGYAGTNTHGADLELLEEVLDRISHRYGNAVSFTFMGCATERISRLPGFRFVQFETTFEKYARKLMDTPMDIVLAPLEDNPFNRCKSNVKWLEYSACGIAGVYSDLPPYACVMSGETGLLAKNTVDDWCDAISYLIENPEKRREIARNARNEVMAGYTVSARSQLFLDTYRKIAGVQRPAYRDIRLSIIIMTWNRAEMLDQCLSSLFANLSDPDSCEIIVGDNGSTDRTEEVLGRYRIDKYVKKEHKIGLEFYRELFDMAEGEYIIDLDDDVIDLPKDFDMVFIDGFKAFPDYGFLGLDVVRNRFTNGAKPEETEYAEDFRNGRTVQEGRVIGCCACIRKDTFEKIGRFTGSDLSMAYVEDGILTQRVQALGMRTGIIKDVKCFHACGLHYSAAYGYLDRDIEKYEMAGLRKFADTYRTFKEKRNMEVSPGISIIIPLYNKVEYTRQCLEALAVNTPSVLNYEVIFIDNASSDGTSEYLRSLSGDVTIITNLKNLGFARACNQGGRLATGDYLVFLNNDTIPKPGWLEALIDGLDRDGADICGSRLLYPDGRVQHAGVAFNEQGIGYHIFNSLDGNDPAVTGKRYMQCVTGACMAMRRELFLELKGFDEGYINGFEDVDLCLRAGGMGKKVLYVPDSKLVHFEESSEGRKTHDEQNARRFLDRWMGKVRCDDNDFYLQEGYGKEISADGLIRIFKQEKTQSPTSDSIRNPDAMERRLERADSLAMEGKYDDAVATYWSVLRADASNHRAMTGVGVVRLMTGDLKEAEGSFKEALAVDPADSKAMSGLGMVRKAQGRGQEAFDCFKKALDSDPENLTALSELLQASYSLNRFAEAEQLLEAYLRYHPADLNMLFSLAGIQMKMGKNDDALEKLDKVLLFDPGFEGALEMQQMIAGQLPIAV